MQDSPTSAAGTVSIRVQVIDVESSTLELVVPTYIPAKDITQRIARDANLGAYWPDGTRRAYTLRARGRLLGPDERLDAFNIVPHELLHLLPQPPVPVEVIERPMDTRALRPQTGFDTGSIVLGFLFLVVFSVAWSVSLLESTSVLVGILPSLAIGMAASNFSRIVWGGSGPLWREPLTALLVFVLSVACAFIPLLIFVDWSLDASFQIGFTIVGGLFGLVVGWIVNRGGVEPLPPLSKAAMTHEAATHQVASTMSHHCGLCQTPVAANVMTGCPRGCDKKFHSGCLGSITLTVEGAQCTFCGAG